ncbi:MAG: hypothetical protein MUP52_11105 [Candidatus Aminicenantes bacterium]|nr:hypothetical protein [Candidatus Aminicenantes bacterium]
MSEEDKKPGRRSEPRVWLYTEHWLWGSTRSELTLEERAVFIDLLCLGITGQGKVDITHRDQVAGQLLVPLDIFNSCIDKGIKNGKFIIKNFKRHLTDFKTYLIILNWKRYQPKYLHERPEKSTKKTRSDKGGKHDAHVALLEDRREGESKEGNRRGEDEAEDHPQKIFLDILREFSKSHPSYPFTEEQDGYVFDFCSKEYPDVDLTEELRKKLRRWEEKPEELKGAKEPRTKLLEWFKGEHAYQGKRGKREFGEE